MDFSKLQSIYKKFIEVLFPAFCAGCGKEGVYLCGQCRIKIPRLLRQRCVACQKPSPFGKTHLGCGKLKVTGLLSSLPYHDPVVKKLIGAFKYDFVDLSNLLSQFMVEAIISNELEDYFKNFIVIPVPLHKRRLAWRGFNQAQLLAEKLCANLNLTLDAQIIIRSRYTVPQIDLKKEQRKTNIINAFKIKKDVAGKSFLVIDDVVTTGSTLNEISRMLKNKKAQQVWALTVAAD